MLLASTNQMADQWLLSCRLEENPQDWLPHMHQSGHLREVIWEEDGEMIDLGQRPTIWSPPDAGDANHR